MITRWGLNVLLSNGQRVEKKCLTSQRSESRGWMPYFPMTTLCRLNVLLSNDHRLKAKCVTAPKSFFTSQNKGSINQWRLMISCPTLCKQWEVRYSFSTLCKTVGSKMFLLHPVWSEMFHPVFSALYNVLYLCKSRFVLIRRANTSLQWDSIHRVRLTWNPIDLSMESHTKHCQWKVNTVHGSLLDTSQSVSIECK